MNNGDLPAYQVTTEAIETEEDIATEWFNHTGLTKREAFAMAAMQGMLASGEVITDYDYLASEATEMANAMLKALEVES